ncbi:MAG: helix-turn-helix transcriptional regulator [Acidimicrobiales bacterium]|nr:helix-turn-helix transcriptional regulator [Acidimicrobiales bacterium]
MLDGEQVDDAALVFRLLGEPTRLRIVWALRRAPASVGELAEAAGAQLAATSQHLAKLRMAGLVRAHRQGTRVIYELESDHVGELLEQALSHLAHREPTAGRAGGSGGEGR